MLGDHLGSGEQDWGPSQARWMGLCLQVSRRKRKVGSACSCIFGRHAHQADILVNRALLDLCFGKITTLYAFL